MFKCTSCNVITKPREPRALRIEYRDDGSILREFPICVLCSTGKPFVSNLEKEKLLGFNFVQKTTNPNDRVQV